MPLLTHNELRLTERRVVISRLPRAFDGFRIVQLSDLHFYEHTDPDYYEAVVAQVNALRPEAVVVTGDVVHYGNSHVAMASSYLRRIEAGEGKFAILGNHDYQDGAWGDNIAAMMTDCGFTFLVNQAHAIVRNESHSEHHEPAVAHHESNAVRSDRLWFAGLDDLWYGAPDIGATLRDVPNDHEPVVMLAHNPLLFDPVALGAHGPVDLVIAGHTHAGHVYIPPLGPIYRKIFRMKYRYGLFEKNNTQLHVTSGVGSAAFYLKKQRIGFPRFRFNTWPEIAVLKLVQGK